MERSASRNRRRGREHASPARRRPGRPAGAARARRRRSSSASARRSSATATSAPAKCAEAVEVARAQTRRARRLGCERIEILVTSPGRQSANSDEFADALARGTGVPGADPELGGRRDAGVGRRGRGARAPAGERGRLRRRWWLGAAGRRHARDRSRVGALGRSRLAAPHDPAARRLRPALGGGGRGGAGGGGRGVRRRSFPRSRRSAWRRAAPRGRCGASSARSTRTAWPRRSRSSRSSSGRRSPSATASRRRGRTRCSAARSSSPRRSGGSACPSSSPAAACAKARRSRSSAPPPRLTPRRAGRGARAPRRCRRDVEHGRRALLQRLAEQVPGQIAVDGGDGRRSRLRKSSSAAASPAPSASASTASTWQAARLGERLDRLHAPHVRAREDPAEVALGELGHRALRPVAARARRAAAAVSSSPSQVSRWPACAWRTR